MTVEAVTYLVTSVNGVPVEAIASVRVHDTTRATKRRHNRSMIANYLCCRSMALYVYMYIDVQDSHRTDTRLLKSFSDPMRIFFQRGVSIRFRIIWVLNRTNEVSKANNPHVSGT